MGSRNGLAACVARSALLGDQDDRANTKRNGFSVQSEAMFGAGAFDANQGKYGWQKNRWIHFNRYLRGKYAWPKGNFNATPYSGTVPDSRIDWAIACRRTAERSWSQGKRSQAVWWLGIGVHALQDTYAQGWYSGETVDYYPGHAWTLDSPTWRSPWEKAKGYAKGGVQARQRWRPLGT